MCKKVKGMNVKFLAVESAGRPPIAHRPPRTPVTHSGHHCKAQDACAQTDRQTDRQTDLYGLVTAAPTTFGYIYVALA